MKKTLLFSVALAAVFSCFASNSAKYQNISLEKLQMAPTAQTEVEAVQTRAVENSINFSYSNGIYSAYNLGVVKRIFLAFELKPEDIKLFAGKKVTGFTVVSPTDGNQSNTIRAGRFFYSTDLTKEDYSQDFTLSSRAFASNSVTLTTPYTITGEEESLYFGYSLMPPKANNMYYYQVDGVPNDYPESALCGVLEDGEEFPSEFDSVASEGGALSMWIRIEGEDLPVYAGFSAIPSTCYVPVGKDYTLTFVLNALSGTPIESVDLAYTLAGKDYSANYVLPNPIPGGDRTIFMMNVNVPAQDEYLDENVIFSIPKVNGKPNQWLETVGSVQSRISVIKEVPVRQTLMEEFTSTGCPWCTRGYAALAYMKENYPEFVTASYHTNYGTTDPMTVVTSFPVNVSGYPSASLNRDGTCDPYYGNSLFDSKIPIVDEMLYLNSIFTPWTINVSHTWDSDTQLTAKADLYNVLGYKNQTYKIAYILVTDGLSGETAAWKQGNNYASSAPSDDFVPQLNDFCRGGVYGKSSVVGLVFDDVVISSSGIKGVTNSVPTSLEAFENTSHSFTFDLSKVKSTLLPDKNKLRVIAAVVDKNGAVLNCAKDDITDFNGAGVEGVSVSDADAPVEYYNLNGIKVSEPTSGFYIRRQGSSTTKVIIP